MAVWIWPPRCRTTPEHERSPSASVESIMSARLTVDNRTAFGMNGVHVADRRYRYGWSPDNRYAGERRAAREEEVETQGPAPAFSAVETSAIYGQFDRYQRRHEQVRCSWCGDLVTRVDFDCNRAFIGDQELAACATHEGEWAELVEFEDETVEFEGEEYWARRYRWRDQSSGSPRR